MNWLHWLYCYLLLYSLSLKCNSVVSFYATEYYETLLSLLEFILFLKGLFKVWNKHIIGFFKGKISVDQSDTDEEDEDENSSEEKDEEENSNEEEDEEEEEDSDSNDSGVLINLRLRLLKKKQNNWAKQNYSFNKNFNIWSTNILWKYSECWSESDALITVNFHVYSICIMWASQFFISPSKLKYQDLFVHEVLKKFRWTMIFGQNCHLVRKIHLCLYLYIELFLATTILTDQYTYLRYTLDKKWFCFCTRTNFVFSGLGEGPDLARGEGNVETSSSSEDEDSEEEAGEEGMNRQTTVNKRGLSLAAQLR